MLNIISKLSIIYILLYCSVDKYIFKIMVMPNKHVIIRNAILQLAFMNK